MGLPEQPRGLIGEQHMRRVHHRVNGVTSRVEKVERAISPRAFAAAIPSTTIDGAEFTYQYAEGVCWRFRYNASSASSYKWEFVGGSPAHHEVETSELIGAVTLTDCATDGPKITVPFAGDYTIRASCTMYTADALASYTGITAIGVGNFALGSEVQRQLCTPKTGASAYGAQSLIGTATGVSASSDLKLRYASATTLNKMGAAYRHIEVTPVRIG